MAKELWRLTRNLYNKPHLITQEAFEQVEAYLTNRNNSNLEINSDFKQYSSNLDLSSKNVGVIDVLGPLTYRADMFEALCGMTSYQTIVKKFDLLVSEGVETIVLYADGPGGEAYGAFETGRYLREAADKAGIKLVSYVDGLSASATYAITASAHEVIINPEASAGSIGVVVSLLNNSKNLEMNGLERTFVYAGENKIPYSTDGSFREDFLNEIQNRVDSLYLEFIDYVASMRDVSSETIMDTKAGVFGAKEALDIGLVTSIKTRQEFNEYISNLSQNKQQSAGVRMDNENTTTTLSSDEVTKLQERLAELEASNIKLTAEAKEKAISELKNKAISWEFAGVDSEAYAVAAYEGVIPVEMFDSAMAQAVEALSGKDKTIAEMKDSLENMESLGDEIIEDKKEEPKVDGVEAELAKASERQNYKFKGV